VSKRTRALISAAPIGLGVLIFFAVLPNSAKVDVAPLLRNLASGLFLTAGVLRMATWRLTRDRSTALSALTLLLLGTALPSTSVLRLVVHDGQVVQIEAPETRMVFVLPLLLLAIAGARHSRRLLRQTIALLAVVAVAIPAALINLTAPADEHFAPVWLGVEALAAAAWAALALQARSRRLIAGYPNVGWVTIGLLLMGFADALKAWSIADAGAPRGLSGIVQLVAAVIAAGVAARGLWTSIRNETADAGSLTRALVDTQQRLEAIEQLQRRRLHDARSAVFGVVGASQLLAQPGSLDDGDSATLRAMVTDELSRLQGLLRVEDEEPAEFEVASSLAAVVLRHRLDGMIIDVVWAGVCAHGRPRATANIVDDLLRNARVHAPGAHVLLAARAIGAEIVITVSDDGPGVPATERSAVLEAGVRGSTARGDGLGLGLYSAARAMTAQSGSLEVDESVCGGTEIVLRLPAARVRAMAS
jgi:signal transduction histidine kinase